MESADERLVIISTDGHCGADIQDYKPYLASRLHDDFDAWAARYVDGWAAIDPRPAGVRKLGVVSSLDPINWDSPKRLDMLEEQGIAAEILFPNTVPPFYPSGVISAPGPSSSKEYECRLAGIQAHNRWVGDFCREAPGRRGGIAQVFLNDVHDAVEEVRRARADGLMGVLLPADHFQGLANLYYPAYDPFWAACVELDMPVHRHGIVPSEAPSPESGAAASAVGILEAFFFGQRGLAHMILGGVFERFPALKFVISELRSGWAPAYMEMLDFFQDEAKTPGTVQYMFCREAFAQLSLKPSEYGRRNCYYGSFLNAEDVGGRKEVGLDRLMWAADFPHHEGTWPWTREALRVNFAAVPDDEVRQLTSLTAADCYGFDLAALQGVADRIGPTMSEIHTPLPVEDYPSHPDETICVTFAKRLRDKPGTATLGTAS